MPNSLWSSEQAVRDDDAQTSEADEEDGELTSDGEFFSAQRSTADT